MALEARLIVLVSQDMSDAIYSTAERQEISMGAWVRDAIRVKMQREQAARLDAAQAAP
jgi:predicted HicB family RNase H-like nuclease